jgi:hypothetical protein
MLRTVGINLMSSFFWHVKRRRLAVTGDSGQPVGPISKGQAVQEEFFLDFFTPGNGTDGLSLSAVRNNHSSLRKIPEECRSRLQRTLSG